MRRAARLLVAATAATVLAVGAAGAATAAPQDGTGPALSVPAPALASALGCTGDLRASAAAGRTPVLTIHGTTATAADDWGQNWDRAFDQQGWAHCDLNLPNNANSDIQVSAEYVVAAIRSMHAQVGSKISILGHSQGGMIARWAFKYWPDTRAAVDDYVSLAASNHGTTGFDPVCHGLGFCTAANWQQSSSSKFIAALNDGPETWPGISYTQITTDRDEVVVPNNPVDGSSTLPAGPTSTNVSIQQLCPGQLSEHVLLAADNAAYLLGMDALTHAGPAQLDRVDRSRCGPLLMPAVDVSQFLPNFFTALQHALVSILVAPQLPAEPPLRCYVTNSCSS